MSSPSPTEPAPGPSARPNRRPSLLHRLEDWAFPLVTPVPSNPEGVPEPGKPERIAYFLSLVIGVFAAGVMLQAMAAYPLPAGGDPAEWVTTSYAFVGLPYPSWIIPGQYPPLLFPLLGILVRIFGPIQASRAFIVLVAMLLSLSTYYLARTLVRSRSVALAVAGFVVFSPTLVQVFFFGGYPNLLGFVFLNLSIAFLVRFVRSGSDRHVFGFWLATAAAILTHELVAVVLVGTLAVMLAFLFWQARIPRAAYRSALGVVGFLVFVLSVGGYYGLTYIAGVPHPQYLQTNAFAYVKNGLGSLYYVVLSPYFPSVHPSVAVAQFLSLALASGVVLILCALRLLAPRRLTLGILTVLAMAGTVVGGAIIGWELAVVTDYLRFGYFLIVPIGLGLGLVVDQLVHLPPGWPAPLRRGHAAAGLPGAPAVSAPSAVGSGLPRRPGTWAEFGVPVFAIAVVALLLSVALVTAPELPGDEQSNSNSFHDATFLGAIHDIQNSGVAGNVFTEGGAAKWARALLVRNAYAPFIATRYTFDPTHLDDEEVTYFAMVARDTVTNSLVASTIGGTNASSDNQTPDFEASFFGVFVPVATLAAQNFSVTVTPTSGPKVTEAVTSAPTITEPDAGAPAMTMTYAETGFTFSIAVALSPVAPAGRYTLTAAADPGWTIDSIRGNLTAPVQPVQVTNFKAGTAPGEIVLNPTGLAGSLLTYANVTPASAVSHPQAFDHPSELAHDALTVTSPVAGTHNLSLTVAFSTPTARNLVDNLPRFINAPTVWQNWSIRFVLLTSNSTFVNNHPSAILWEVPYLENEFGATVLATDGVWTVLLLPPNPS
ncbi:MAG: glycosyltransferase family 39 protein [Thermoplasmata archaeon]|nr:glycosyltransferase family 39 protein [Thermoplasmata archaeon]